MVYLLPRLKSHLGGGSSIFWGVVSLGMGKMTKNCHAFGTGVFFFMSYGCLHMQNMVQCDVNMHFITILCRPGLNFLQFPSPQLPCELYFPARLPILGGGETPIWSGGKPEATGGFFFWGYTVWGFSIWGEGFKSPGAQNPIGISNVRTWGIREVRIIMAHLDRGFLT